MTRFASFAALYVTALFLEPAERWKDPRMTALLQALAVLLLVAGLTRKTLPVFLVAAMAHPLALYLPDVPNHVNVEIYASLLLLVAIGYTLWRKETYPTDDDCFEMVRPVLQLSMVLIYVPAGFDTFNTDFLNPQVSCVGGMLADLTRVGTRTVLGVPRVVLAAAAVGLSLAAVLGVRSAVPAIPRSVRATALALALLTGLVALRLAPAAPPGAHAYLVLMTAGMVILWALVGIVSGFVSRTAAAFIFNLSVLFFLWPILRSVVAQAPRPAWPGVSLWSRRTPAWPYAFPVVLVLHGVTSYLGFRTAGNFTMFSNLRTEGPRSNHILLGRNPLKIGAYQEDVVRFTAVDDSLAAFGDNVRPLRGNQVPVVEFRKWIYQWTREGRRIPMTLGYRGQVHATEDITADPAWRTPRRDWAMRLMDFRIIQTEGANACRW